MYSCILTIFAKCQSIQKTDTILAYEKAAFPGKDVKNELSKNAKYPKSALENNIQGDVIVSFVIRKDGKLDSLIIESSPASAFSTSAIVPLNAFKEGWIPAKISNNPVDKTYLMVFRFRMYLNSSPQDYKGEIMKHVRKLDYDKALRYCNEAIADNPYNGELFEFRSVIKERLGDKAGALADTNASLRLSSNLMSVVNVFAIGVSRTERSVGQPAGMVR